VNTTGKHRPVAELKRSNNRQTKRRTKNSRNEKRRKKERKKKAKGTYPAIVHQIVCQSTPSTTHRKHPTRGEQNVSLADLVLVNPNTELLDFVVQFSDLFIVRIITIGSPRAAFKLQGGGRGPSGRAGCHRS